MKFQFTHKEAKELLTSDVLTMTELLEKTDGKISIHQVIRKGMKGKGYRYYTTHQGTADVFINRTEGIVFKIEGTSEITYGNVPKRAIPTAYGVVKTTFDDEFLVRVQPLAQRDAKSIKKAINKLEPMDTSDVGVDCHHGNVGIYKGKYVMIDW